jgi:hypothetical protein
MLQTAPDKVAALNHIGVNCLYEMFAGVRKVAMI